MTEELSLPSFRFRSDNPSVWTILREGIGNPAAVIPAAILDDFAVQLPGPGAPLIVSSPGLAREVLNDRADHFARDRFMRRLFRRSWGRGLAAAEGEDWQRQRRAAVPFFRPQAVKDHLAAFAAATDAVVDQAADGEELDLGAFCSRIVARVVFGVLVDAGDQADPDAAAADVAPYIRRIGGFTALDLLPLPEWLNDWFHGIDRDPAVQRLRRMGSALAEARSDGAKRADMIALLEGVGPIADNIRGLFPAAMDTTVAGLGWAFHILAKRRDWQDRVADEGNLMGKTPGLERLAATRQVVNEVLRLYPPAPLMVRSAARGMELGGHRVRKGQSVLIAVYAMHRHPRLWDEPDTFEPDRWLAGSANPDAYMPFGSGPRMCLAAHFAQAEMAIILARTLSRLRLESTEAVPQVSLQVTTRSLNGLHVIPRRR